MRKYAKYFLLTLGLLPVTHFAQDRITDSLEKVLQGIPADTSKFIFLAGVANGNGTSTNQQALHFTFKGLALAQQLKADKWIQTFTHHIANIYFNQADYVKSMEYYLLEEKLINKTGAVKRMSGVYCGMGNVCSAQKKYAAALDYYKQGLSIVSAAGNKAGSIVFYLNMGEVYYLMLDYDKALEYYALALKTMEEVNNHDPYYLGNVFFSIADIHYDRSDLANALANYSKAKVEYEKISMFQRIGASLNGMAKVCKKNKNYSEALEHYMKALALVKNGNVKDVMRDSYLGISETYAAMKDFTNAYAYHTLYTSVKDSILNTESSLQMNEMQAKYESEKKQLQIESLQKEEQQQARITREENTRKNVIIFSVTAGFLLVVIFSVFVYNRFRITKRQKIIIEKQKRLVEEKQKEILDSIYYARRIQRSLLTNEGYIRRQLLKLRKADR